MINKNKTHFKVCSIIYFLLILCVHNTAHADELSALELLNKSDKTRNMYYENAVFDLTVTSFKNENEEKKIKLKVYSKGVSKSLVHFLSPSRDYGKKLLMLDQYLWFYIPGTRKPIRISPQQKMMGQVSYADVARTNFSADYTPELVGIQEVENQKLYILKLKAKRKYLSYQNITYSINFFDYFPVSAIFHAISGKAMKKSLFFRVKNNKNEYKIKIISLIKKDEYSILECSNFKEKDIPDKLFNKNYLKYNK